MKTLFFVSFIIMNFSSLALANGITTGNGITIPQTGSSTTQETKGQMRSNTGTTTEPIFQQRMEDSKETTKKKPAPVPTSPQATPQPRKGI